jgi:hypothetical protein
VKNRKWPRTVNLNPLKKSILLLLLIFASANSVSAQNYIAYHNKCNAACPLIERGNYREAKQLLLDAISIVETPLSVDYFNLAKCYSQLAASDSTLLYLVRSLAQDFRAKLALPMHTQWFEPILGIEKWNEILETDYLGSIELTEAQLSMNKRLNRMTVLDQYYRDILSDSINVYHPTDTALAALYEDSITINDAIVVSALRQIIEQHGWPGYKNYYTGVASLFLIHFSEEEFRRMDARLKQEIDLGNLSPSSYVDIADAIRLNNGLEPMYNGYFSTGEEPTAAIEENCKMVGAGLGSARQIRSYFRYD